MPWFVWMSFFTAPCLVGVAVTLAWPILASDGSVVAVLVIGLLWVIGAWQLQRYLKAKRPHSWSIRWTILSVVLPLVVLGGITNSREPAVAEVFVRHDAAINRVRNENLAPAAPSRQMLSWKEVLELVACVHAPTRRYLMYLLTSLPPAWWLVAFLVAIWKGK